ncbi:MAG: Smr/MutS family protein, partial [Firmicutes bacterium]|nr:Smr/MutS family protein [Candidatus Stercoripulliclostridium pullicola]
TSNFKLDDLVKLKGRKKEIKQEISHAPRALRTEAFSPELNLLGLTSAEAEHALMAYLDKAVLAGVNEVRIIHGYGTGKLRETVQKLLKNHPAVVSFRDGKYGEGERGVTMVRFTK